MNAPASVRPATPLPFFALTFEVEGVEHLAVMDANEHIVTEVWPFIDADVQNAAYIVHACNRLPQLEADLAECVAALQFARRILGSNDCGTDEVLAPIDEALAKIDANV